MAPMPLASGFHISRSLFDLFIPDGRKPRLQFRKLGLYKNNILVCADGHGLGRVRKMVAVETPADAPQSGAYSGAAYSVIAAFVA